MSYKTTPKSDKKPFWIRPPWSVLFDLIKLHRIRPWDINISYLLTTLMSEMQRMGYINFTASGMALLSSATIFRMKSELILELQEPPASSTEKPAEFLPPPLQLPYRFEYTSTTIDNLIKALEETLNDEVFIKVQPELASIIPEPPTFQVHDQFMTNIENKIDEMYRRISQFLKERARIPLSKLTIGLKKLETIRTFLLVLFIANRGQIQLNQEEDFGEIYISLL